MADARPGTVKCGLARVMVAVFVCVTAAVSLTWSHSELLSIDEFYSIRTDSLRSVAELAHVQRLWPISLDPLLYHVLSHGAMQVFGVGPFALRLPAFLGFLLMQVCLFFFVRNLVGERGGVVVAAFPALTATLFYATEGRPYGLLLGMYALAMLCWQVASRREANRSWALVGLAVALAAAINAHYFGVLILVPICVAEMFRTLQRRRIDWPMAAAIVVGMAGFLAAQPFAKAAREFRKNYYGAGRVGLHDITQSYRSIFVDYGTMPEPMQRAWELLLVVFAAALVWGCWRVRREVKIASAEWVLLLALAALPFFGYLLGRFVTHSIEVRYSMGALVAISSMLAIAMSPWLRRDGIFFAVLVAMGLGVVGAGAVRIRGEQQKTAKRLASLTVPAELKAALMANPDGRLYVQDLGNFEEEGSYEPDADVHSRMTLVYSSAEELQWNRHDTVALTVMHMEHFTDVPMVVSYEDLKGQPGEHMFLLFHSGGWDWTDQAIAQDGASMRPVGKVMNGDVVAVRFK